MTIATIPPDNSGRHTFSVRRSGSTVSREIVVFAGTRLIAEVILPRFILEDEYLDSAYAPPNREQNEQVRP